MIFHVSKTMQNFDYLIYCLSTSLNMLKCLFKCYLFTFLFLSTYLHGTSFFLSKIQFIHTLRTIKTNYLFVKQIEIPHGERKTVFSFPDEKNEIKSVHTFRSYDPTNTDIRDIDTGVFVIQSQ